MTTRTQKKGKAAIVPAVIALGFLLVACSSSSTTPTSEQLASQPDYSGFVAATDFVVGENRFPFGLLSKDGEALEDAQVQVSFYLIPGQGPNQLRAEAPAKFREVRGVNPHRHDDGQIHEHVEVRGVYVVDQVNFDGPGFWGAEYMATTANGQQRKILGSAFEVKAKSPVPNIGDLVPPSRNLTLADVGSIEEIETRVPPDDMHDLSVARALEQGKPLVVVFSTPLFCVTRMCGPVTDVAAELHGLYHALEYIDQYRVNYPNGVDDKGTIAIDYGVRGIPETFFINSQGTLVKKFVGPINAATLRVVLDELLASDAPSSADCAY